MISHKKLVTALLCLACIQPAISVAQLSGTLFSSPQQRAYLNYLREDFLAKQQQSGFNIQDAEIPEIPVIDDTIAPVVYKLSGIVQHRDGRHTIWLNERALSESDLPSGVSLVNVSGQKKLRFLSENGEFDLKPGQTLELNSGLINEASLNPALVPATGLIAQNENLSEADLDLPSEDLTSPNVEAGAAQNVTPEEIPETIQEMINTQLNQQ